ncbi:hypothetical protein SCHPADRAFT_909749 [Schizopora paradoxa]|uniref:Secreted protein n=1 Tax=Schizopora paradoxa TaxID=27342 RepID=A0A0H2R5V5_9AGAM|nr:hypothetical protein SCHPADRAFT_909749 [Schizopora paradoxa]
MRNPSPVLLLYSQLSFLLLHCVHAWGASPSHFKGARDASPSPKCLMQRSVPASRVLHHSSTRSPGWCLFLVILAVNVKSLRRFKEGLTQHNVPF